MNYSLIIDPLITGNSIAYELRKRGFKTLLGWSSIKHYEENFNAVDNMLYDKAIIIENLEKIKKNYTIDSVVPGSDIGIEMSITLGNCLNLKNTNSLNSLKIQLDRSLLSHRLGEKVITGSLITKEKIVIKPKRSIGGFDRISIVDKDTQIDISNDFFGQPYYHGTEYAVDFVSYNGIHKITSAWRYNKVGIKRLTSLLIDNEDPIIKKIYEYCSNVLDKAEYKYGASHIEIVENNNTFRLIECNFRHHGHLPYIISKKCLIKNQIEYLVDAITGNIESWGELEKYRNNGYMLRTYFIPTREIQSSEVDWTTISNMDSVQHVYKNHNHYDIINPNRHELRNVGANIILYNLDKEKLIRDYQSLIEYLSIY